MSLKPALPPLDAEVDVWPQGAADKEASDEDDVDSGSWLMLRECNSTPLRLVEPLEPDVALAPALSCGPQVLQIGGGVPRKSTRQMADKHGLHHLPGPIRSKDHRDCCSSSDLACQQLGRCHL